MQEVYIVGSSTISSTISPTTFSTETSDPLFPLPLSFRPAKLEDLESDPVAPSRAWILDTGRQGFSYSVVINDGMYLRE